MRRVIVVIDDEESLCRAFARTIKRLGTEENPFEVVTFNDPIEATRNIPDIDGLYAIFTDLNMPGASGFYVADALCGRGVPVVMVCSTLSVEQDAGIEERLENGTLFAHIHKPSLTENFATVLMRIALAGETKSQPPTNAPEPTAEKEVPTTTPPEDSGTIGGGQ